MLKIMHDFKIVEFNNFVAVPHYGNFTILILGVAPFVGRVRLNHGALNFKFGDC